MAVSVSSRPHSRYAKRDTNYFEEMCIKSWAAPATASGRDMGFTQCGPVEARVRAAVISMAAPFGVFPFVINHSLTLCTLTE